MRAGASLNHNRIVLNLAKALDHRVGGGPGHVWASDVRLRALTSDSCFYPDVMVVCGKPEIDSRQKDTVLNPSIILEVLSDSTDDYERTKKFKEYRSIPSLQERIMIDQSQAAIELYRRDGRVWVFEALEGLDAVLQLKSLEREIPLTEIYRQVEWSEEKTEARKKRKQ
jgi:Uma2 family endonuclease